MKVLLKVLLLLKDKRFWASALFIVGSIGMMTGNDFLPSSLQTELADKIVYVTSGIAQIVTLVIALYSEVPQGGKNGKK